MLKNYFNVFLLFLSVQAVHNSYAVITKLHGFNMPNNNSTEDIIEQLGQMHHTKTKFSKKVNKEATILHAACLTGNLDWIKEFVKLNRDNNNLKTILKTKDSNSVTAKQWSAWNLKIDIAGYLGELEKELNS